MIRTSESHPLKIASLQVGPGRGKIGVTFAPGKYDHYGHTGAWERDLATDLDAIAQLSISRRSAARPAQHSDEGPGVCGQTRRRLPPLSLPILWRVPLRAR